MSGGLRGVVELDSGIWSTGFQNFCKRIEDIWVDKRGRGV